MYTVLIGRFILDCIFNTPIHDTYSILAGLEALVFFSKAYRFISRQVKIYRRYMKQLSVYPLGASPTITIVTYLLKQSAQMTLLAINGGIIMPLLIGITAHLYIFLPVDMLVKSLVSTSTRTDLEGGNKSMEISLSMQWCYGIVLTVIAVQIAPAVRNNFLIELLREVSRDFFFLYMFQLLRL